MRSQWLSLHNIEIQKRHLVLNQFFRLILQHYTPEIKLSNLSSLSTVVFKQLYHSKDHVIRIDYLWLTVGSRIRIFSFSDLSIRFTCILVFMFIQTLKPSTFCFKHQWVIHWGPHSHLFFQLFLCFVSFVQWITHSYLKITLLNSSPNVNTQHWNPDTHPIDKSSIGWNTFFWIPHFFLPIFSVLQKQTIDNN